MKQFPFNGPEICSCKIFFFLPYQGFQARQGLKQQDLQMIQWEHPTLPMFASMTKRMKTFKMWPPGIKQRPTELAEAGLYYTDVSDHVKCYHCGNGFTGWWPDDDPWEEHIRHFPNCFHVKLMKDKSYIDEVKKKDFTIKNERENNKFEVLKAAIETSTTVSAVGSELVEQLELLNPDLICKICLNAKVQVVSIPCGHLGCCLKCFQQTYKCPVCRSHIHAIFKVYL